MTTLVALASKDALVMGADSLGTASRNLVDPLDLLHYFDPDHGFRMKLGPDGNPVLTDFNSIFELSESVPYNQLSNVTKVFDLGPLPMGVMFTGITSIGGRTIGSLLAEFKSRDKAFTGTPSPSNYAVATISKRLLTFLSDRYMAEYSEPYERPALELIVGGYDKRKHHPVIFRIDVAEKSVTRTFSDDTPFGITFGGQMDWIQRIVFGTDMQNQSRLAIRTADLLEQYHDRIETALSEAGIDFTVPQPGDFGDELRLFTDWGLKHLDANWGDFSEQNAIECVDFFIEIMIRAQGVSSQLSTVGGDVHVAVIRKQDGFRFVSREEWTHRGNSVNIPGVLR